MSIKRMDIKEFRANGYLQEVNRRFFHPLGLALEVVVKEDGSESLGGIWDYRDDPEGMIYDIENSDEQRKQSFKDSLEKINAEFEKRRESRIKMFGGIIEPII